MPRFHTDPIRPGMLDRCAPGHTLARLTGATLALLGATGGPLAAQGLPTPEVFRRHSSAVVKIEVTELASAAKTSAGSGFFIGPHGQVVTNYHVIADLVGQPGRYRADVIDASGEKIAGRVVRLNVVHDLALLETGRAPEQYLSLSQSEVQKGLRLYALGHPADLGLSIVEGTYNGLLEHTLYNRIHFTGSLDPGMSGGPAITESGAVVGVNVSTAGNQLSFLVPASRVQTLLEEDESRETADSAHFAAVIEAQLREHQERYFNRILQDTLPTVEIEGYRVPTRPADFFNCWGDVVSTPTDPYEMRTHECSTDDYIYISPDHSSGTFRIEHTVLGSEDLNVYRFFALYSTEFQSSGRYLSGRESDVTEFRCETRNVQRGPLRLRSSFCARAYRKYRDLYDVMFRLAALGDRRRGLVSAVTMTGIGFENAQRFLDLYLRSLAWE